jgi:glycerophosphoryl diester phosphodiesterase
MRLLRGDGPPLRVGHRGAALLAPENTLRSFEAALAAGAEAIEFDVLDLLDGPLVLAHSNDLLEVSHGAAAGTVRDRTLGQLREVVPELPTLDDALAFLAERPQVVVHVDLKLTTRLDEVARALARHRLEERTVVSSFHLPSLVATAQLAPRVGIGFTYPEDRHGVARHRVFHPAIRAGTRGLRRVLPRRVRAMAARAGAHALMLHHAVVSAAAVERAHDAGVAVWAWTVDTPGDLRRMLVAGVDAVITNDPRIFVTDPSRPLATLRP